MNIEEGNRLIAEFMGVFISDYTSDKEEATKCYHINDICYHSDWNWLMDVVEKIEKLGYDENEFDIFGNCVQLGNEEFVEKTKIEAVYKTVVWFITNNNNRNID